MSMSIKQPKRRTRLAVGAVLSAGAALGLTAIAAAPASAVEVTTYAAQRQAVYVTYYNVGGYVFNEAAFCTSRGMSFASYIRAPGYIADTSITCVYWVYA